MIVSTRACVDPWTLDSLQILLHLRIVASEIVHPVSNVVCKPHEVSVCLRTNEDPIVLRIGHDVLSGGSFPSLRSSQKQNLCQEIWGEEVHVFDFP